MRILLLLLLSCIAAPAQLAIYTFSASAILSGGMFEANPRLSGVFIIDLATDDAFRVERFRINGTKVLAYAPLPNLHIWHARNSPTTTRSLMFSGAVTNGPTVYRHEFNHYTGKDALIPIGAQTFSMPRSFKSAGSYVRDERQAYAGAIATETASYTFSSKATEEARVAGETLEAAALRFIALYRSQGYLD